MSALQQDIYNQIKFRTKHLQHGWAYFTLDEVLRHDKVVPAWVYENPQLKKDRWTGLLDKEQKEIYEGDIVKDGNYVGVVEWGVGRAGFIATGGNQSMAMTTRFGSKAKDCEVIGNIYENPELITNLDKKK